MSGEQPADGGLRARLETSLRALAKEETARLASHPGTEELAAYSAGRLTPAQEDRVQEHLSLCRDCTVQVVDVAQLAATATTEAELGDAQVEALWRRLVTDLNAPPAAGRWTAPPVWLAAVAASLLIAALGLAVWVSDLRRTIGTLSGPQLNTPVAVLVPGAFFRDAEERRTTIDLPPGAGSLTLVMALSERASFGGYSLEIAAGDSVRWRGEGMLRNAEGSFTVTLARSWLPLGRYHLRVFGHNGTERRLLATFPIELRQQPRGAP